MKRTNILIAIGALYFGSTVFAQAPHVVFVTGDHEYGSELSMPMIADILESHHGIETTVLYAVNEQGERDPQYDYNIPGLEALEEADAAVFFLRFRKLPEDQLKMILDYVDTGKPIIGLRTSTHAFRYDGDDERSKWNDAFGRDIFGQKWITHHGHNNSSRAHRTLVDHPILRGVENSFWVPSWLYTVSPLHGDARVLLIGQAIRGTEPSDDTYGTPQPVAWTKTYTGPSGNTAPVFFTTLGHPRGFLEESLRRVVVQGIMWTLDMEDRIPEDGVNVEIVGDYDPPNPQ